MDSPDANSLANNHSHSEECCDLVHLVADPSHSVASTTLESTPTCDTEINAAELPPAKPKPKPKNPQRWSTGILQFPKDLVDLLLPPSCLCCQKPLDQSQSFLCASCLPTLALIDHACLRCGAPLPKVVPETHGCLRCQGRSWSFTRAIAVGPYYGPLQKLVIAMKKLRHEATTLYFGRLLAARLIATGVAAEIDYIVPVPSHWWRRLIRKISTAEVLAEAVSRELNVPWTRHWVRRRRYTPKQGMMRAAERKANVQGAFVAHIPARLKGARVLLIDDVLTSGSTANEVSRALLQAGAKEVVVGAIARALGDQRSVFVEDQATRKPNLLHPVANSSRDSDHGKKS